MKTLRQLGITPTAASASGLPMIARSWMEQQIDLYEAMMKQTPTAAFLRQQALLIDMALSALKLQKTLRKRTS